MFRKLCTISKKKKGANFEPLDTENWNYIRNKIIKKNSAVDRIRENVLVTILVKLEETPSVGGSPNDSTPFGIRGTPISPGKSKLIAPLLLEGEAFSDRTYISCVAGIWGKSI